MPRKKRPVRRRGSRKRRKARRVHFPWVKLLLSLLVLFIGYVAFLDFQVYRHFEGKRWSLPARVYARPLELYVGRALTADQFVTELKALGYRFTSRAKRSGEVSRNRDRFQLVSRPFRFWDGDEPSRNLRVEFDASRLTGLRDESNGKSLALARLDPLEIGSIHTARQEDRILLRLDQAPDMLVQALLAVEDRHFYAHHGVSPLAIARAMWVNLRSGKVVQGGSTLTQQLVKNFFLTNQRSLWRKFNEAIMSFLLEIRYSKDEILEAYLNEIYLAQDGQRAIHGFGLGSQFFFQRPVNELDTAQIALLVGMIKGPSYYDPRRNPERAKQRRDLVLRVMRQQEIITPAQERKAVVQALGVAQSARGTSKTFPAFLDLVRRQLRRDYRQDDLVTEGLHVFTTLDPQVQWAVQRSLHDRVRTLRGGQPGLQGAVLISRTTDGEVLALTGGKDAGSQGFNRALDARRPVGSLVKPAVYLTALEQPARYNLVTLLDDSPLSIESGGKQWEPDNYDHRSHGEVMLYQALAHSYNLATARLGLELGLDKVIDTLHRLGIRQSLKPYPSLLLGAADMTLLDVSQLYQGLASGGFLVPLRSIRAVLDAEGEPLQRYSIQIQRVIDPGPAMLATWALQSVVTEGTGRSLNRFFSPETGLAGKTGTTNGLRDSWFAGFDGEKLGVVWLGRDDNQSMGLTGSSGAMQVWADVFKRIGVVPLIVAEPEEIEWHRVDLSTGGLAGAGCADTVEVPFNSSGRLPGPARCNR